MALLVRGNNGACSGFVYIDTEEEGTCCLISWKHPNIEIADTTISPIVLP